MTRNEYRWERFSGRDREGDHFITEAMIHGTGRVLVRIRHPEVDEYYYRLYFFLPKSIMETTDDSHDFISLDSAIEFAEQAAELWDDEAMVKLRGKVTKPEPVKEHA